MLIYILENTPPMFLWHTEEDTSVPMENSLLMAKALKEKGIEFELHIFLKGRHGLGLRDEVPYVKRWAKLCEEWLVEKNLSHYAHVNCSKIFYASI